MDDEVGCAAQGSSKILCYVLNFMAAAVYVALVLYALLSSWVVRKDKSKRLIFYFHLAIAAGASGM